MGDYLYEDQRNAVSKMHNGCILVGGTGAGKSITALAYYFESHGGKISIDDDKACQSYTPMKQAPDLIVITTAKKRDDKDWDREMARFFIGAKEVYDNEVIVDSWQNICKYANRQNAFFIFDEDHLVGSGKWVIAFLEIAKHNEWIVLSATPADSYIEFCPVFIANGFFKSRKEFIENHVVYDPFCRNFPRIKGYMNTGRLIRLKNRVIVKLKYVRESNVHDKEIKCTYDIFGYKSLIKERWNIWKEKPIENASDFCYCLRRFVNSDQSRVNALLEILKEKKRVIVFYNYDYELEILKNVNYAELLGIDEEDIIVAELNGHAHDTLPDTEYWVYLVNYVAGAEAWECITTDTIVFYSQTYSYKTLVQAKGRIDRRNTPFSELYYYHLISNAKIDLAVKMTLDKKKKFNETMFSSSFGFENKPLSQAA